MQAPDHTHRAIHATLWSAIEITARYGMQFVVTVVLARILAPADFGLIAMLLVFTTIGALLANSGFGTALVQRQHTTADEETTVFFLTLAISGVVAAALFIAAPAIAGLYSQPGLTALTRLFVWVLPLGALSAVPDAILTRTLNFRARASAEVIASTAAGCIAVALAWRGYGAWSIAWQAIISTGLRTLFLWVFSGWRPLGRFHLPASRKLFGFGGYMLMTNLLDVAATRLQSLLIGLLFDSRTLGYYAVAQNTQQAPTSFIAGILNRVGLPLFSSVAHEKRRLLGALRLSLRVSMFLFVPCMLGIAIIAKPLIGLLYGARWLPAAPLLTVLALGASVWPLHVLNLAAISAQGRSDLFFKLGLVKKIVAIILVLVASPAGALAIAWSTVAASAFSVAVNTHYSRKLLGYGIFAQLADQKAVALLSCISALCGWSILHWNPPSQLFTVCAVVVSAAVYLGLAIAFRSLAMLELMHLLRRLLKRRQIPT